MRDVAPGGSDQDDDRRDRALLSAHVSGSPDAFERLVRLHRDRLYAVAVRTLGDREEAADALQDALLSAFRAAPSYRGEAKVTTWLHRVVVNACLDRARRQTVRRTVPLPAQLPADQRDHLGELQTAIEVAAALADLPIEQRLAIALVDLHGFSVDEAAQVLGVPSGTVKSRCSRGRARLAVALGHLRNPEPPTGVPPMTAPEGGTP